MNTFINEVSHASSSSKGTNLPNQISNRESTRKLNKKKDQRSPIFNTLRKQYENHYLSLYPRQYDKIKHSVLSVNPEREFQYNPRPLKNTYVSFHNPLKNYNNNLYNMIHSRGKTLAYQNMPPLADTNFFVQRRNSHQIEFPKKHSRKNLKQIQRELQFKLLDMSIRIENDTENDEKFGEQELNIQRNSQKRFTEYTHTNIIQKNNLKSYKTNYNPISNNLYLNQKTDFNSVKTNKTNKTNAVGTQNINKAKPRRQSYIPKSLLSKKFEKNPQQSNERLNLSVNMNLYRDLIPNIDMNKSEKESNVTNKSMLISKNKINIKKILLNSLKNEQFENKYRLLMRQKELYDSYEDEEIMEELEAEYFYINPETYRIYLFDTLLLFATFFGCIYLPFHIAQSKCFCTYIPMPVVYILFFLDAINIIDIIISFFRAYYNFEYTLEKQNSRIVSHYLQKYFFLDLLTAIPLFTLSYYLCNLSQVKPDGEICLFSGIDMKYNFMKMLLGLKIIKLKKVLDKKENRGINHFHEVISENYTLEKTMKMLLFTFICIIGFHFFICYHIYIGLQSYPNWILKTENQDSSFVKLYIISFYFLITTITSVGYGDITCASISETLYQIIILTIGVIAYSWIASTIGNYVKKETRAAMKYNKDISLLEEIRVSYPKMSFKLYNKIHKHLETVSHQQERLDTNLLVTNLPYTLKNQIMFIIYGSIIKKFKFFKDCENSDFILRVLTSFIPLSTKKGAFIIQEGDIIDNIVFVREGRLSLVATIDLDEPLVSIEKYLGEKFEDINEKMDTRLDNSLNEGSANMGLKLDKATTVLKTFLKTKGDIEEENIEEELAKKDFNGEDIEIGNLQFLNILDILKNEHYGIVYLFLKKPAPLTLRVKSKYSQLFLLRKNDTMQISKAYPNVWKKIYYKSYHNMKSIKKMTKKIIINYCRNYGHKYNIENSDDTDKSAKENDFLNSLGVLNSRKRKQTPKKIGFSLEGNFNSNKTISKPKSILKHKMNNRNDNIYGSGNKKSVIGYKSFRTNNYLYNPRFYGTQMQKLSIPKNKAHTNINQKNMSFFSSKNKLSSLGQDEIAKTKVNQINHISNNINYNIVINDVDLNNDSKSLLKADDNQTNTIMKKTFKSFGNISNLERSGLKRSYFVNIPSKIKGISNIAESKNNINIFTPDNININSNINVNNITSNQTLNKVATLKINNNADEDDLSKNKTLEMDDKKENKSDNAPNTINDLSKSLLKKVKKKIKKRRKRKKLYKMLINKITESMAKVNPNINLNSSGGSFIFSSKIGDMVSINPESNYIIDEKPELNQNMTPSSSQELNGNMDQNLNQNQFNNPQPHDYMPYSNPHELFLIPETIELSSSESSSDNSSESKSSENKEESAKTDNINNTKINENIIKKKEVELTISENTNFTLNTSYENLNTLSEGNYSKDENLQKSVLKLIQVYLTEKAKTENDNNNKDSSAPEVTSISKSPKIKDNFKEKNEKEKEKDVWSFLDDDSKKEKSDFKINNSKDKEDSLEKRNCKSPQARRKKTNDLAKKRKSRKMYDNLFSLDEPSPSPKNKKNASKKKARKNMNKTTVKKNISRTRKKNKKKEVNNTPVVNLLPLEKEEETKDKEENKEKDENKNEEKNKDMIDSLELDDLEDAIDQHENYKHKNYKTYQHKGKKEDDMKNDTKSGENSNDLNSKEEDNYG